MSDSDAQWGQWENPPNEFGVAPFWFWNDRLDHDRLVAQLDDFVAHGVGGFVLHPRVGLPRTTGFLSDRMLDAMKHVVAAAAERQLQVILYDEGMYPSGSGSGRVVAENAAYRTRGLVAIDLDEATPREMCKGVRIGSDGEPQLSGEQVLVRTLTRKRDGHRFAIINRHVDSVVRGLHYVERDPPRTPDREPAEDLPPAADLLNPEAVACFIRVVYDRMYEALGDHFGKTITAVFTDEPNPLSRGRDKGDVRPGTIGSVEKASAFLGYDIGEHLLCLWEDDEPDAQLHRANYRRAIQHAFGETFFAPLQAWCREHGVALTGHPSGPDDIGQLRYFDMPGQDIVWRYIEPDKASALEGPQSTQAKCASSAMLHYGRRRNLNEYCGAFGHEMTRTEMDWLLRWLAVRGCNLFTPHAFYYSTRGPRIDERPPDVGPNSPWWDTYGLHADEARRLAWLNTDSTHVCSVAILGEPDWLPWESAKVCYQNQVDFNYLDANHFAADATVDASGIAIANMKYSLLIVQREPSDAAAEAVSRLRKAGRCIDWKPEDGEATLASQLRDRAEPDVAVEGGCASLRVRHVVKDSAHWYVLFNETKERVSVKLQIATSGEWTLVDPANNTRGSVLADSTIDFEGHQLRVLRVT